MVGEHGALIGESSVLPGEVDVPRYSDQKPSGWQGGVCQGQSAAKAGPGCSCQALAVPVTKAVAV